MSNQVNNRANSETDGPRITIIGTSIGPSASPQWAGHPALANADVVIGGARLLEELDGDPARKIPAQKIPVRHDVAAVLDEAETLFRQGKRVVVLATGDPLFFGIGASFAERFGAEHLRIYPAISSLQEAAARLALPWSSVTAVSLHGRSAMLSLAHALLGGGAICVLTDTTHTPAKVAAFMLERGRANYRAAVFANLNAGLGMPEESAWRGSPETLAGLEFPTPNVMFLLPDANGSGPFPLCPGNSEDAFAHENSLITKWPVRAAALAALRIEARHTVWDLGAGSGAVAVEAAALAHKGLVVAVEKNAARAAHIAENRRRFGAANLEITHAAIRSALPTLPAPDRIFIGGGLGSSREETETVIQAAWAALPPGGRIVISCVLLSTLENARETLAALNAPTELTQIQASFAAPLGRDLRLQGANPVFLLAVQKD